jgi:hypothetical protein
MKRIFFTAIILFALLAMTGCNLFQAVTEPTLDPNEIQTLAAGTVQARQTMSSLETKVAILTAQPTDQPSVITATPRPATSTPLPTGTTVVLPTTNPTKTPIPATPTIEIPCLYASFVSDVTIPDGTTFTPGAAFTKTWRIKNRGTCTWTTGYSLVFSSGNAMSGPAEVDFTKTVAPGGTIDLSINLVAPSDTGTYTGYYKLRSNSGETFGLGIDAKNSFWVKINVALSSLSDLHLAKAACSAVWKSNAGTIACPSSDYDFSKGSVKVAANPKLAGGYVDDQPAIVMVPANGSGGDLTGRFPALEIKSGDHFSTLTGFIDGYTHGNVMFMLNYSVDGGADQNLKTWTKTYDTNFTRLDIDLSSLAGKKVQFVLKVLNNDGSSTDDVAFWLDPQIVRP